MNSDYVQRYHILDNGYGTPMPNGKWVKFEDVKLELERIQELIELKEAFAMLHTHQEISHKLKNFNNECLEKSLLSFYGRGFLHSIDKCINLVTESMEENI